MAISRLTAMTIRSQPDSFSLKFDGVHVLTAETDGRWAVSAHVVKNGILHSDLLSTPPAFKSEELAEKYMRDLIARIRQADL